MSRLGKLPLSEQLASVRLSRRSPGRPFVLFPSAAAPRSVCAALLPGDPPSTGLRDEHVAKARRSHRPCRKLEENDPGVERNRPPTPTCCFASVPHDPSGLGQVAPAQRKQPEHLIVVPSGTSALRRVVAKDARYPSPHGRDDLGARPDPLIPAGLNRRRARVMADLRSHTRWRSRCAACQRRDSDDTDKAENAQRPARTPTLIGHRPEHEHRGTRAAMGAGLFSSLPGRRQPKSTNEQSLTTRPRAVPRRAR
jgi:hypothetical protein